jgi:hypothetical protein
MTADSIQNVTHAQEIQQYTDTRLSEFAKSKGTEGYTNEELVDAGLSPNRKAAKQRTYRAREAGIVRTVGAHRPQRYYHKDFVADVEAELYANKHVTLQGIPIREKTSGKDAVNIDESIADELINHSLESNVLPLMRKENLGIHKFHFHVILSVDAGYSDDVYPALKDYSKVTEKGAKVYEQFINGYNVKFHINPNNTVMVYTESSRRPLPLASQQDKDEIIAWWGEIRQALKSILFCVRSNLVPQISEWIVTGTDLNTDVQVPSSLHFSNNRVKVKHLSHLFQVYVKSLGYKTVTRLEIQDTPKKPAIEWIEERFTFEGLQRRLTAVEDQVVAMADARAKDRAELESLRREVEQIRSQMGGSPAH